MNHDNELNMELAIQSTRNIDAHFWTEVSEAKKAFLESNINLRELPHILPEVADSWIRSRAYEVNPYINKLGYRLKPQEFKALIKDKEALINITATFIKKFMPLLTASSYTMVLIDENGIILLIDGEEREIKSFENINIVPGTVMSEETVGTTAHTLSIHHRLPVQIIGPYNYCMLLQDNISSSAPIFDENGIIGILAVVQMLGKNNLSTTQIHSLGWVTSMAYAIEKLLKIEKQNRRLCLMNATLEATLSVIDEGFITIDENGYISQVNREGAKALKATASELIGKHYTEFMSKEQTLLISKILQGGKAIHGLETTISNEKNEMKYIISIEPVLDGEDDNEKTQGVVIRLNHAERIDKIVNARSGSTATYTFHNILGNSRALNDAMNIAKQIGGLPTNVLLIGESGTGKELFAQAMHNQYRPEGPFVAINCAALPRNLIESELFGYEGGAFTGAERKGRPGKIELANGGTLFLDEIGDMPLEIQPILLRVLEDKKVMRLGGSRYIAVDFRVIAATNKNLYQMVHEKTFREDLYYRLTIFKIMIPPLRDRDEDVLYLANYFIQNISEKMKRKVPILSPEASKKIAEYSWPGNVRQLENAMVYAVNMAHDGIIKLNNLPDELQSVDIMDKKYNKLMPLRELEKMAIEEAMVHTGNNTGDAAKILGMSRTTLYRKLKELDLSP
jgi:transcriptional regulator with PAS, ATPase and Fis domain